MQVFLPHQTLSFFCMFFLKYQTLDIFARINLKPLTCLNFNAKSVETSSVTIYCTSHGRPNAEITLLSGPRVLIISFVQTFSKGNILHPDKIPWINLLGNFGDLYIDSELRSQLSPERNKGWIFEPALPGLEKCGGYCKSVASYCGDGFFQAVGRTWLLWLYLGIHLYPWRKIAEKLGRVKCPDCPLCLESQCLQRTASFSILSKVQIWSRILFPLVFSTDARQCTTLLNCQIIWMMSLLLVFASWWNHIARSEIPLLLVRDSAAGPINDHL